MKWIKCVVAGSYLIVSNTFAGMSWGQTQAPPARGTASLEGTVLDAETRQPVIGAIVSAKSQSGTLRAQEVITTNGAFQLTLDPKQPYIITTRAEGYEPTDERLAFTSSSTNRLYGKVIRLYKIGTKPASPAPTIASTSEPAPTVASVSAPPVTQSTPPTVAPAGPRIAPPKSLDAKVSYTPPLVVAPTGKATQMRSIQFVQSKAELLPDAQPALDQLLDFMKTHPTAEIELAGHTDNQGDFDENVRLSKQRVELVKAYLVKGGITANRISTRGYGPTRPIASNNAEASRQLNRRVEMTVLRQ